MGHRYFTSTSQDTASISTMGSGSLQLQTRFGTKFIVICIADDHSNSNWYIQGLSSVLSVTVCEVFLTMSLPVVLSESERAYILGGVRDDVRADGRGCRHVRHFSVRTGVVSNTSGSALIERVSPHTHVPTRYPCFVIDAGKDECYCWSEGGA